MREQNIRLDNGENEDRFISSCLNFVAAVDDIFGFLPSPIINVPSDVSLLADQRKVARQNKDWVLADEIRDELINKGWTVEDLSAGYKLKKIKK